MNEIIIQKVGTKTQVVLNNDVKFEGGRVEAKKFAKDLSTETGFFVYNIKKNGTKVLVING